MTLTSMFVVLAQAEVTSWVGIIVQTGALGLLWVIAVKLAPAWLEAGRIEREKREVLTKEEREKRDERFATLVARMEESFAHRNENLAHVFTEGIGKLIAASADHTEQIIERLASSCGYMVLGDKREHAHARGSSEQRENRS